MILLSCSNCSYNALQYGAMGLSAGYCVQHRVVLPKADETTCGRHLRKDLAFESRERAHNQHRSIYALNIIQSVRTRRPVQDERSFADVNDGLMETDSVAEAVTNWGVLDSKIATLAQLKEIPGVRAELAMLSLSRGYTRRCFQQSHSWTSGLHVFWWTRQRLSQRPEVMLTDIRRWTATGVERQVELAAWSLVMLRLTLISDVAFTAKGRGESIEALADVVDAAAEATEVPDLNALMSWIRTEGEHRINQAFPYEKYDGWRAQLHRENAESD